MVSLLRARDQTGLRYKGARTGSLFLDPAAQLLIDLAERCSGLPALALADNRSHLKQRLLAMKSALRLLVPPLCKVNSSGSSALLLLITASVAQVPTHAWERQWGEMQLTHPMEISLMNTLKLSALVASAATGLLTGAPVSHQAQVPYSTIAGHTMAVPPDTQASALTMESVVKWEQAWTNVVHRAKAFPERRRTQNRKQSWWTA